MRRVVGLRNPGHSVVKLMQPDRAATAWWSAATPIPNTHESMAATFELMGMTALLSRGLEGESAADPRRTAQVDGFVHGRRIELQAQQPGTPGRGAGPARARSTSRPRPRYTRRVLAGEPPVPDAIAQQVAQILQLAQLAHDSATHVEIA